MIVMCNKVCSLMLYCGQMYMVVAQGVNSLLGNLQGKEGNFLVRLSSSEENKYALSLS